MSETPCTSGEEILQKITQDLYVVEEQLHKLEVEGLNQAHPWAYLVLQRRVDQLVVKKRKLQDAWDRAMNELAICRLAQARSSV